MAITKFVLQLEDVKRIAAAAEAEARDRQWAVSIAIVDDGGHLLLLHRLDGASALSSHVAPAKAHAAAIGRRETRVHDEAISGGRHALLTLPNVQGLLEGGIPIVHDHQTIGAIGVSGVKSEQDAQIARAGVAALRL
ncbi:MAG TPA: heme-binding protein [Burkholderiaceae bacterium]